MEVGCIIPAIVAVEVHPFNVGCRIPAPEFNTYPLAVETDILNVEYSFCSYH